MRSANPIHDAERHEHYAAVEALTEFDRARYDDPHTYADTMTPDGTRL